MAHKSLKKVIDLLVIEESKKSLQDLGNYLKDNKVLSDSEIDKILSNFSDLKINKKKKEHKTTAYQNFVRVKMPEHKNSGRTGQQNMALIGNEWKKLDNSEKIKYNPSSSENENTIVGDKGN